MGCYESKNLKREQMYLRMVINGIDNNDPDEIDKAITRWNKIRMIQEIGKIINNYMIDTLEYKLNCLAYSVFVGKDLAYYRLLEFGCSVEDCEASFQSQGLDMLVVISSKGNSDILKHYINVYLERFYLSKSGTVSIVNPNESNLSPCLNAAIKFNHLNIISTIYEATKSRSSIPAQFSFHSSLNVFGENSGLLACRLGHYHIVKYLYSKEPGLFLQRNKQGDNAIHITCCGSLTNSSKFFSNILEFLISPVGLDITENYLKSLITLQDPFLLAWFESKLNGLNIETSQLTYKKYQLAPPSTSETFINISNLTDDSSIIN